MSIAAAIQHPNVFYCVSNGDWCSTTYFNLWSINNTGLTSNDDIVIKTVYDPSPVGYCLPAPNAWTGFTTTGQNSSKQSEWNVEDNFKKGWLFYCAANKTGGVMFYSAQGTRYFDTSKPFRHMSACYYWSAGLITIGYARALNAEATYVHPLHTPGNSRALGFPVYPVREQ